MKICQSKYPSEQGRQGFLSRGRADGRSTSCWLMGSEWGADSLLHPSRTPSKGEALWRRCSLALLILIFKNGRTLRVQETEMVEQTMEHLHLIIFQLLKVIFRME